MSKFLSLEHDGLYRREFERDSCGIGFIADVEGRRSHDIVRDGIQILINLTHRGAVGSEANTGDGAGIMIQLPDRFLRARCADLGFELPPQGQYGVGMFFMPNDDDGDCRRIFEKTAREYGCPVIGWREVPVDDSMLGPTAQRGTPKVEQAFVKNPGLDAMAFERKLYLIRRVTEHRVLEDGCSGHENFYVPSMSSRIITYKGMFTAEQVPQAYADLTSEDMESAIATVHARYSTNTFPSWPLAQPFRILCHNGEINTLRGNINKMMSRHSNLVSKVWGEDIKKLLPVIVEGGSDSACLDNMLELLVLSGRSLAHSILMMIPEAWGDKYYMGRDRRGFYEYHSMFMEPWDGPASIVFTDGVQVGGILDRNGLRPSRYVFTRDSKVVLASEAGVLDFDPKDVITRGRLQPGKMLLVDTARKRILSDDQVKAEITRQRHYRRWVAANRIELQGFGTGCGIEYDRESLLQRQVAFGYTREDLSVLMTPMATGGSEPIGSMGNDTPLAVLSDRPQPLFNYFKQIFAQVTNPPIDPIREDLVMSLTSYLGREGNILDETPEHSRRLKLTTPILTEPDLNRIKASQREEFRSATLDILFDVKDGEQGLERAVSDLCRNAGDLVEAGYTVLILSDRGMSTERASIPSLLAVSSVGHHLINTGTRNRVGIVLETGEPREVNHFALLSSYGCDAVNPYLALDSIKELHSQGIFPSQLSLEDAIENYIKAINKGILKILSKMGISTLRSYRGAQVYEAVGLRGDFIDRYFTRTISRIGGIGIGEVGRETLMRHDAAFGVRRGRKLTLPSGGLYAYRRDGERHLWTPETIHFLQQAVRRNDRKLYDRFAELTNNQERRHVTLRSLFEFDRGTVTPVPLEEVEPASGIMKRFVTGAMSFGSLSREAHEAMAIAMNRIGGSSNSGEGGEDPERFKPLPNGDSRCSATKQIASARFGVTAEYIANCREIQIKMAQGAKPGEGGHLPGHKVNAEIAEVRNSTPGVSLISPPPHHDIYSIEDLKQLIFDLKNGNPEARISVKLVSMAGVGTIAAGVSKGHADMVLISGGDGGTGASPLSSIKHAGLPWELGLSETHQTLLRNDLRSRIRVQTDGQMRTGRDLAIAALLGAEEYGFGTVALVTLGCIMMRKCHLNTCPVGVATQDPRCRARFTGKPEYVVNFMRFIAEEMREIMASLGIRTVDEMIGRADLLKVREGIDHWKAKTLDFNAVFHCPKVPKAVDVHKTIGQDHGIEDVLDRTLIGDCGDAVANGTGFSREYPIRNINRTTGAMLSNLIAKRYGHDGLPEDTLTLTFTGTAGQSFGAFASPGMTMILDGDANDYLGKMLSGGKIIVRVPKGTTYDPAENVIIGNVALYGATAGEIYINGLAGERFAVRNSGVHAVVEGVGDHACEYMTGGVVAVLGGTGVNFAAGMSGGFAYVYDPQQDFDLRCNLGMVDLDQMNEDADIERLRTMIEKHHRYTGSERAKWMLDNFDAVLPLFVKVMPMEYRRALGQMAKVELHSRRTEEETVKQF